MKSRQHPKPKVRDRILHLLKTTGPRESTELAASLGVSAMAVRQHLYEFQKKGLVDFDESPRPMGRPAKIWKLTENADQFFPDRYQDLLVNLIKSIEINLGEESLAKLLRHRAENQIAEYSGELGPISSLRKKIARLATIRSREGYMADVEEAAAGGYLLVENHCPICRAAQVCSDLCASELEVFRKSLGEAIEVDRVEHILSNERRCVYHIRAAG